MLGAARFVSGLFCFIAGLSIAVFSLVLFVGSSATVVRAAVPAFAVGIALAICGVRVVAEECS